jgi:hypothetical protein
MSGYFFTVKFTGGQPPQGFVLHADTRDAAEHEAEYVLNMYPTRLYERQGRLYDPQGLLLTVMRGEVAAS